MGGRRTNLAVAAVLVGAVVTGAAAFAVGTGWARWPVVAHGMAGLAVVILTPWKSLIVRRGLARKRPGRAASIVLGVLVLTALASGILFATVGRGLRYGPLNAMQVHVGSALLALPVALYHVWSRRGSAPPTDFSRRDFLRTGGLAAGAGLLYVATEGLNRALSLPGADRRFTGSYEKGSFVPQAMPVTQWLNDAVPRIEAATWRLVVVTSSGRQTWTLDSLSSFTDEITAILDCTGGWHSTQRWEGARLDRLIGPDGGASFVVRSATGYRRRYPLGDASAMLVAVRVGGEPLSAGHGFPARIVAPGRRGFWWVKWVTEIEVDDRPWWWQSPFPLT